MFSQALEVLSWDGFSGQTGKRKILSKHSFPIESKLLCINHFQLERDL